MQYRCLTAILSGIVLLVLMAACSPQTPTFHTSENPARLSDWNLFTLTDKALTPAAATVVFQPANPLFTDYAQKLRTLWLPDGATAQVVEDEILYPVGTILTKTFYYPRNAEGVAISETPRTDRHVDLTASQLIETRLLVRREAGWQAFPYIWNEEQTEAFLRVAGGSKIIQLKTASTTEQFVYFVPNENQCAGCHVTEHPNGDLHPLAATARQLRTPFDKLSDTLQLDTLRELGWLANAELATASATVSWQDTSAPVDYRASAYLEIHCGHCHNPQGAADTSALILDGTATNGTYLGVCKPPVAAGGGAGDRLYGIVPGAPERSILLYRMESTRPDEMMPELGRSLPHAEGIELIRQWIAAMPGDCTSINNR